MCAATKITEVPVHFVGSIAYHFEDILRKHCDNLKIKIGMITNKPVDYLMLYHMQKDFGKKNLEEIAAANGVTKK